MRKNILLLGGSGYIGRAVIDHFREYNFINLSLKRFNEKASNNLLFDLRRGLEGITFDAPIEMIINCTDLIACAHPKSDENCYSDTMRALVEYAKKNGIKKIIHFSSYADVRNLADERYTSAKLFADRIIEKSGLEYVTFSPTVIFGRGSLFDELMREVSKLPFMAKNALEKRFAPVYIDDVMRNLAYVLEHAEAWNRHYIIKGPERLNLREALNRYNSRIPRLVALPEKVSLAQLKLRFEPALYDVYTRYLCLGDIDLDNPGTTLVRAERFY